jgi:RNA polymerase sigma-70 factor (ECF subfamily)
MAGNSTGSSTRPSLLLRIREPRDTEAWQTLVEIYGRLVYRHCRGKKLLHQDAENVTQEVFAQISQSIRAFDYQPDLGRFRDWLGTVTRHEIQRFQKKEARAARGGDPAAEGLLGNIAARDEDTNWDEAFHAHVLATALARCRPHFANQTWRAFELVWLEKRPTTEVAKELNLRIDQVYVAKSRVLDRLEQEVRELADDSILVAR